MGGLIQGERVTVVRKEVTRDSLGEPSTVTRSEETIDDVIVAPGGTSDLDASRPDGVEVAYTICLPKGWAGDLRGCEVIVRGEACRVVGDPKRYTEANTPGDWDLTAEVVRVDG